jgi:hypothetical protein
MVPENVNSGRSADFKTPRKKIIEPPARMISPLPSTSSPSRAASRNSQANDTVTPGPLQHRGCHREQAIVRERHEGAAMDIAHAVEVFLLDPERAAQRNAGRCQPSRMSLALMRATQPEIRQA